MWRFFFFFFQAEDGIRDLYVTGVQTCALPICEKRGEASRCATLDRRPVRKLSAQITVCPSSISRSQRCEPMKPPPPATRALMTDNLLLGSYHSNLLAQRAQCRKPPARVPCDRPLWSIAEPAKVEIEAGDRERTVSVVMRESLRPARAPVGEFTLLGHFLGPALCEAREVDFTSGDGGGLPVDRVDGPITYEDVLGIAFAVNDGGRSSQQDGGQTRELLAQA